MAKTAKTIRSLDELPAILQVRDIMDVMGLSKVTVYDLVNSNGFPVLKIGKRLTIPKKSFIKWMDENTGKNSIGKEE